MAIAATRYKNGQALSFKICTEHNRRVEEVCAFHAAISGDFQTLHHAAVHVASGGQELTLKMQPVDLLSENSLTICRP